MRADLMAKLEPRFLVFKPGFQLNLFKSKDSHSQMLGVCICLLGKAFVRILTSFQPIEEISVVLRRLWALPFAFCPRDLDAQRLALTASRKGGFSGPGELARSRRTGIFHIAFCTVRSAHQFAHLRKHGS